MRFPAAPWAPRLKAASMAAVALLAFVAATLSHVLPRAPTGPGPVLDFLVAAPPVIVAAALLFMVRGYQVEGRELGVQRLLWVTRVPLDGLERAWHDPEAMRSSFRIFGNGGLFAISGLFRNRALGNFRAFVTNPGQAVVLRTPSRVVVISPAEPRAFLHLLATHFPNATFTAP